jgi:ABC-2 type transport system permease protein
MSVFNAILKSLKSNIMTIIVYFSIFAVFGNMQARATVTTQEDVFEEVTVKVAVTDKDNSKLSRALVSYLESTQEVVDPKTDDPRTMNDNVRYNTLLSVPKIDEPLPDLDELSTESPIPMRKNSLISNN